MFTAVGQNVFVVPAGEIRENAHLDKGGLARSNGWDRAGQAFTEIGRPIAGAESGLEPDGRPDWGQARGKGPGIQLRQEGKAREPALAADIEHRRVQSNRGHMVVKKDGALTVRGGY